MTTIDEGISLLTGLPAGTLGAKGEYPAGSVNRLVVDRLIAAHREGPRVPQARRTLRPSRAGLGNAAAETVPGRAWARRQNGAAAARPGRERPV